MPFNQVTESVEASIVDAEVLIRATNKRYFLEKCNAFFRRG
jgi:hypothetical protein